MNLDYDVVGKYGPSEAPDPERDAAEAAEREARQQAEDFIEQLGWAVHSDPYGRGGVMVARSAAKLDARLAPPVEIRAGDVHELKAKVLAHVTASVNKQLGG